MSAKSSLFHKINILIAVSFFLVSAATSAEAVDAHWTVDNNGINYTTGAVGIGISSDEYNKLRVFTVFPEITTSGTNYFNGVNLYSRNIPIASGVTDNGHRIGLVIEGYVYDQNFQGTLDRQYGILTRHGHYAPSAGTINNSYGVFIDSLTSGSTSIGNLYALYQKTPDAKNYFAGNVGIGTTSPKSKLHVNGNAIIGTGSEINGGSYDLALSPYMSIWAADDNESYINHNAYWSSGWKYRENAPAAVVNIGNGFSVQVAPSGTKDDGISWITPILINSSGKVGIGTTSPESGYLLTVDGKIIAEEIKVTTVPTADFVFKDDYNLMSLDELEKNIKKNKHLPDIPSAKEVAENGVNVGEMQSKLLQKVEELTLYMIEQNKKINDLEREIEKISKD